MNRRRPPELELIYEHRDAQALSMGAAARAAGISHTYWRMIETGERVLTGRKGVRTLARMALAAGVPPGAMKDAGRADIESDLARLRLERAESLAEAREQAGRMVATLPGLSAVQRAALEQKVTEVIREVRESDG